MLHSRPNLFKRGQASQEKLRQQMINRISDVNQTRASKRLLNRDTFFVERGMAVADFGANHIEAIGFAAWLEDCDISSGVVVYAGVVSCPDITLRQLKSAYADFIMES